MSFLIFALLSIIAVISGLLIIFTKNPIYNVLLLLITLLSTAGIYGILGSPFISAIQLLVYAGAGVVLVVFVSMFYRNETSSKLKLKNYALSLLSAFVIFVDLIIFSPIFPKNSIPSATKTKVLSTILLQKYTLPFELITILIFVGIIGIMIIGKEND